MNYSFDVDVVQKLGSVNVSMNLRISSAEAIVRLALVCTNDAAIGGGIFSRIIYKKCNRYDPLCLPISFHPVYRKLIRLYDKYDRKHYLKNMDPISLSMIKASKHEILQKKSSYVDALAHALEETTEWKEFIQAREEYVTKVIRKPLNTKIQSKSFSNHLANKMTKAWKRVICGGVLRNCFSSVRAEFIEYFEKRLFEMETFIDNSNFC